MDFLDPIIQKYVEEHSTGESPLLQKINRETHLKILKPRMLSGHLQGRVLSMLSHMISPRYILEVGTYTGYSALCMAEGLQKDGKIITIDINEELQNTVQQYFNESPFADQILYQIGNAQTIIPSLDYTWDLAFIDADKAAYSLYFDQILPKLRPGGFMIFDNVLWSGKVTDADQSDKATQKIRDFNVLIQEHPQVENVLMPIRDGLMVLRKL